MSESDISSVWANVSHKHRHLPRTDAVILNENFLKKSISDLGIKIKKPKVIDWGPGGGWLSKSLDPQLVNFVDIVDGYEEYVSSTFEGCESELVFNNLRSEDFEDIDLSGEYDYGIMYSVIYHMPSIRYAVDAVKKMLSAGPKYVFIRNVFTDEDSWERSQYNSKYSASNYIRGNILNFNYFEDEIKSSGYEIVLAEKDKDLSNSSSGPDRDKSSYSMVLVLEKK